MALGSPAAAGQYLRRNLSHIENMLAALQDKPEILSQKEIKRLEVIRTIFRQQEEMYLNVTHTVKDRIVSIHQPQIRPMVRGKASADVEFGPKLSLSVLDGFLYLDHLRCLPDSRPGDPYNESLDLIVQINKYRRRFGHYPKVVIADQIYGTRENRNYLREKGIRFFPSGTPVGAGKKLGRPPKEMDAVSREMERLRIQEQGERNEVEAKIRTAKTRYGLGKVMTKTEKTSDNWITMAIFSLNMGTALRLSAIQAGRLFIVSCLLGEELVEIRNKTDFFKLQVCRYIA
ncbi:MAG: transposase [Candidatus Marinimicrobia bacterium]|nr:transposase [bacterium]MCG2715632.1 transposase [Candidatus Neomarinimicrobiota bacterium]